MSFGQNTKLSIANCSPIRLVFYLSDCIVPNIVILYNFVVVNSIKLADLYVLSLVQNIHEKNIHQFISVDGLIPWVIIADT